LKKLIHTILFLVLGICYVYSQENQIVASTKDSVLKKQQHEEPYHEKRQKLLLYGGSAIYGSLSAGLYFTWYKQYDQSKFHFFNDMGEWRNMDKAGHVFSGYLQSDFMYHSLRWAGVDENKSIWYGAAAGIAFQSTIEIMDAFSTEWGFSVSDMISNGIGVGAFALQQKNWGEQRIRFKMSSWPKAYSEESFPSETGLFQSSINDRSNSLFGNSYTERFLKDYNAQTIWMSVNLRSFFRDSSIPSWLNVAVGYSGENLFGGFSNSWKIDNENISVDIDEYPRHGQFLLALDYDLSKIKTNSKFLKTVLGVSNGFKFPAPAIEYNTLGELNFHLVFTN